MKCYAGIGSRETPQHILNMMDNLAQKLEKDGYALRSGGADGADNAFAKNVTNKEIFIPWNNFNGIKDNSAFVGYSKKAYKIAKNIHPAWYRCSEGAKKLHSRNVHQVFGWEMKPKTYSKFIICWTPKGKEVGGTATAIKLAKQANITVYNLAIDEDYNTLNKYLTKKTKSKKVKL